MMSRALPLNDHGISLNDHCIHLAPGGAMRAIARTHDTYRRVAGDPELRRGHLITLHRVNDSAEAHYPTWERHPDGDELLIVASGSLSVELREDGAVRTVPLPAQAACIVPAGIWHRLVVHAPSRLMTMTLLNGTTLENPAEDPVAEPVAAPATAPAA